MIPKPGSGQESRRKSDARSGCGTSSLSRLEGVIPSLWIHAFSRFALTQQPTVAGWTERVTRPWTKLRIRGTASGRPGRATAPTPSHSAVVGARHTVHRVTRVPLHYFFFGLALLLMEDFGLAAGLAFLPDLHPHVLHILVPFRKELGSA